MDPLLFSQFPGLKYSFLIFIITSALPPKKRRKEEEKHSIFVSSTGLSGKSFKSLQAYKIEPRKAYLFLVLIFPHPIHQLLHNIFKYPPLPRDKE
jgi:hypothetical protein